MSAAALSAPAARALQRPITAMLLWQLVLTGRLDEALLALLGLKEVDITSVRQVFATELTQLELLHRSGRLPLDGLALVARGMLAEKLDQARSSGKARDLIEVLRAFGRLPLWVRNPELDQLECEARSAAATARIIEAHARREEAELQRLKTARSRSELTGEDLPALPQPQPAADPASPVPAKSPVARTGSASASSGVVSLPAPVSGGATEAGAARVASEATEAESKSTVLVSKEGVKVKSARAKSSPARRRVHH